MRRIIAAIVSAFTLFAFFFYFRWAGIKGLISFILGMGIMAYLLIKRNRELISAADYIEDQIGGNNGI